MTHPVTSRYAHLMADFDLRPRQLAAHLRDAHGIEPRAARRRYEREVWHGQHEYDGHRERPLLPHADTARSAALMPDETCPSPCATCAATTAGLTLAGEFDADVRPHGEWWANLSDARGTLATYAAARIAPMHALISAAIVAGEFPFAEVSR